MTRLFITLRSDKNGKKSRHCSSDDFVPLVRFYRKSKLVRRLDLSFFPRTIIAEWNKFPEEIVSRQALYTFKSKLLWFNFTSSFKFFLNTSFSIDYSFVYFSMVLFFITLELV